MALVSIAGLGVAALAGAGAYFYQPIVQRGTTVGLFRPKNIPNLHPGPIHFIENTLQCEDMHYHKQTKRIFAACAHKNSLNNKQEWFPPFPVYEDPSKAHRGSIFLFDPKNLSAPAEQLALREFYGPFVTHGLDIFPDPGHEDEIVWIHAVNHAPNQEVKPEDNVPNEDNYRPRIETFRYEFPQHGVKHVRTVEHPLIRTPNDIFATSPTDFYVTNDHHHRHGFMRKLEDFGTQELAPWGNVVHVHMEEDPHDPAAGIVRVTEALADIHSANGLGHASRWRKNDVLLVDAAGGVLHTTERKNPKSKYDYSLKVTNSIQMDSTLDNPSWYEDVYATPGNNASGYVLAGLARAVDFHNAIVGGLKDPIPSYVWHVTPPKGASKEVINDVTKWEKKLIFADDGNIIKGGTIALMVPINPKENNGKKQATLVISGFATDRVATVNVTLDG